MLEILALALCLVVNRLVTGREVNLKSKRMVPKAGSHYSSNKMYHIQSTLTVHHRGYNRCFA